MQIKKNPTFLKAIALSLSMAFAILSGCRTTEPAGNSSLNDAAAAGVAAVKTKLFLVAAGGWGSCSDTNSPVGSRAYDSFINLVENLEGQFDVFYVFACLYKLPPWRPLADLSFMGRGIPLTTIKATQLTSVINSYVQQIQPAKVYTMGHSYGGWVVLNMLRQGLPANMVFTMDPIDAERCLPITQLLNPIGIGGPGCANAPVMNYPQFIGNTAVLRNYWQDIGLIHGSPILPNDNRVVNRQEHVENHPFLQGKSQSDFDKYTHRLIGAYGPVWQNICESIAASNNGNNASCTTIVSDVDGHIVLRTPVVKSIKCSKSIIDQQTGQQVTWVINLDDIQQKVGVLTAVRGSKKYFTKDSVPPQLMTLQSAQGGSAGFSGPGVALNISLYSDGRTANGTFDLNVNQEQRHVPGMFCVVNHREAAGGQANAEFRQAAPVAAATGI